MSAKELKAVKAVIEYLIRFPICRLSPKFQGRISRFMRIINTGKGPRSQSVVYSFYGHKSRPAFGSAPDGSGQSQFGDVMGEKAVDVVQPGAGEGILGLHHSEIVGDSRIQLLAG